MRRLAVALILLVSPTWAAENFVVRVSESPSVAAKVLALAEEQRALIYGAWFSKAPQWERPCELYLLADSDAYKVHTNEVHGMGQSWCVRDDGKVYRQIIYLRMDYPRALTHVLPHEIAHAILASEFSRAVPLWIDEGIAVLSEPMDSAINHGRNFPACRSQFPLRHLLTMSRLPHERTREFYAHGLAVCAYLIELGGKDALIDFLRVSLESDAYETGLRQVYGIREFEDFEAGFAEWNASPEVVERAYCNIWGCKPRFVINPPVPQPIPQPITPQPPPATWKPEHLGSLSQGQAIADQSAQIERIFVRLGEIAAQVENPSTSPIDPRITDNATNIGRLTEWMGKVADEPEAPAEAIRPTEPNDPIETNAKRSIASQIPWPLVITGALSATGVGLPVWAVMAWRGARTGRRLRKHLESTKRVEEHIIRAEGPERIERNWLNTRVVEVDSNDWQNAYQWAKAETIGNWPTSRSLFQRVESLIGQYFDGIGKEKEKGK